MSVKSQQVWIVGAGLAGALLAALLAKRGFKVTVSERRSSVELEQLAAGRSINLALAARGLHALASLGTLQTSRGERSVKDAVLAQAIAMPGRMVHLRSGEQSYQPYAADGKQAIWSVHRARLNRTLLRVAEQAGAQFRYDERVVSLDLDARTGSVERAGAVAQVCFDLVIGADGAGSVVRDAIAAATASEPYFAPLDHGYKELTIAPAADGKFALPPAALHIWPRGAHMLIALPNPDYTFTCTLFLQNEGSPSFAELSDAASVRTWFSAQFPDAVPLMPEFVDEALNNPLGKLATLHCPVWHYQDRALILGDAAHALVPFHGQGMNCAFEDCVALARLLDAPDANWGAVFAELEADRKPQATAIAQMALENYLEMRDQVADPQFQLRKALEQSLALRHPGHFVPRYELVSFTRHDYALAQARGVWQSALLNALTLGRSRLEEIDLLEADRRINAELPPLPAL